MKEKILRLLRQSSSYISGQELCQEMGVSRTAIWKTMNNLKDQGYQIEAVPNKGYRLISAPDILTAEEILSLRKTKWVGQEVYFYPEVDSTNTKAKELAEEGKPNGTLVLAEKQTAGKGRRGRNWESPTGVNIAMTLVLKPEIEPNNASMLTLVAALATAEAISDLTGQQAMIKWPNDIVLNGKKIVGILTEMSAQFDYINHIVVGIGINVNTESFPEAASDHASSLYLECGEKFRRAELVELFLEHFEEDYEIFLETEDLSGLQKKYNRIAVNMGRSVRVLDPKEPFEGKSMGITNRGELIVDTWESRRLVSSGEVSVRGIYGYV